MIKYAGGRCRKVRFGQNSIVRNNLNEPAGGISSCLNLLQWKRNISVTNQKNIYKMYHIHG
jgi:hypothetical protein